MVQFLEGLPLDARLLEARSWLAISKDGAVCCVGTKAELALCDILRNGIGKMPAKRRSVIKKKCRAPFKYTPSYALKRGISQ
jgi:hypothetical protein